MPANLFDLASLLARVAQANGSDRRLDYELFCLFSGMDRGNLWDPHEGNDFTSSPPLRRCAAEALQARFDPSRMAAADAERPDWFNECAREIGKLPPEWQWFQLEAIGDHRNPQGTMVTGAVCTTLFTRGPRKGTPKWAARDPSTERKVFIADGAIDAKKAQYEAETGKCHHCCGGGHVVRGWSIDRGTSYRLCSRCKGSGLAPGIDARSDETRSGSAVGESPTRREAPNTLHTHPNPKREGGAEWPAEPTPTTRAACRPNR